MELREIKVLDIDIDDATFQVRGTLDQAAIEDYAKLPVDEFKNYPELRWRSTGKYAIISGHHRIRAFQKAGVEAVQAYVHDSMSESDGLVRAIRSNEAFGVRMTTKDRRLAIEKVLLALDREDRCLTTSQIAELTGFSSPTVERYRDELIAAGKLKDSPVRTTASGKQRKAKNKSSASKALGEFVRNAKLLSAKAQAVQPADWAKMDVGQRAGLEAQLKTYIEEAEKALLRAKDRVEIKEGASVDTSGEQPADGDQPANAAA